MNQSLFFAQTVRGVTIIRVSLGSLLSLLILFLASSAQAQQIFWDTIEVKLKQHVHISKKERCGVHVHTIGTHPDPKGNGKDGDYSYFGTYLGEPKKRYYGAGVAAWVGIPDSPGEIISYTEGASWTDSPKNCNYGLIAKVAGIPANSRQYARYQTKGGPVAFFEREQVGGLSIDFDASQSYVATEQGHKPISSYEWDFGDDRTGSGVNPTHEYEQPGTYKAILIARDDQGRADTCTRTVKVNAAMLALSTRIEEERANRGDTVTMVGIVKNIGTRTAFDVVAFSEFSSVSFFPDSVLDADLVDPVLTPVLASGPVISRTQLASGDTFQVRRQFVVTQLATYKRTGMLQPEDISIRIEARLAYALGRGIDGDTLEITRPCDGQLFGWAKGDCERSHTLIGGITKNMVVNSIEDRSDEDPADGKCSTGRMIDVNGTMVPECTLRAAIEEANAAPGLQYVEFSIPGTGIHTISPFGTELPAITDEVVIDATTQPGYTTTPLIVLDGAGALGDASGITLNISDEFSPERTKIKGLAIVNFPAYGIYLAPGVHVNIEGNHVGTNATGTIAAPNKLGGIYLRHGFDNLIFNNVISGNDSFGICFGDKLEELPFAGDNILIGNKIGTNIAGNGAVANNGPGILLVEGSSFNQIGDPLGSYRNIISGNKGDGIFIDLTSSASSGRIIANYIGTDVAGKKRLPNTGSGIHISVKGGSSQNVIGGVGELRNLISANLGHGILLEGDCDDPFHTAGLTPEIYSNYIGTDVTGKKALGNVGSGIFIRSIMGAFIIAGNVIGANASGIVAEECFSAQGADPYIINNFIGTDATQTVNLGNVGDGIRLTMETKILSEGKLQVTGNTIAGNKGYGLAVLGPTPIIALDNRIGFLVQGGDTAIKLGNTGAGVYLGENSDNNWIGWGRGLTYSLGMLVNTIAYNAGGGIIVMGGENQNLRGNFLFQNGLNDRDIDLGGDGITINDRIDDDEGPNDLTNTVDLDAVYLANDEIFFKGSMAGRPFTFYEIDLYGHGAIPGFGTLGQGYFEQVNVRTSYLISSNDGRGKYIDSFAVRITAACASTPSLDPFQPYLLLDVDTTWSINGIASFSPISTDPFAETVWVTSEFSSPLKLRSAPTITEPSVVNGTKFELSDHGSFSIGDKVIICPGCENEETATIEGFGSIIVKEPLKFVHEVGEAVVPFARSADSAQVTTTDSTFIVSNKNLIFHNGTAISVKFVGATGAGTATVERFRRAPLVMSGIEDTSALPHRWVVGFDSTLAVSDSTEICFRLSGIPKFDLERPDGLNVYWRPTVGAGVFNRLNTWYDKPLGQIAATGFTGAGEFVLANDRPLGVRPARKTPSASFVLSEAYPNPFRSTTSFDLEMPQASLAVVAVYNSLGQQVKLLHDGRLEKGVFTLEFDARDLTSGMYFIQAATPEGALTRQVLYMP